MPPGRDLIEQRRDAHVEHVQQRADQKERREEIEDVVAVVRIVPEQVEQRRGVDREPVADGSDDSDQAEQVEPTREPAPRGAAELRRPVVETTCGRIGRGDLGHREHDEDRERADDHPSPGDGDRLAPLEREIERRQAAREDRDDREADREVPERAHRAKQLLRVAKPVQGPLVVCQMDTAGSRCVAAHARPPSLPVQPAPEPDQHGGLRIYPCAEGKCTRRPSGRSWPSEAGTRGRAGRLPRPHRGSSPSASSLSRIDCETIGAMLVERQTDLLSLSSA